MKKINYPLLDSLSDNSQKVYLFLILQKGKNLNPDAVAAILHMTEKELYTALLEISYKK